MALSWKFRYSSHLGVVDPDAPLFLHSIGNSDPLAHVRYAAQLGFAGIQDNHIKRRPVQLQLALGAELARCGLELTSFVSAVSASGPLCWGRRDTATRAALADEISATLDTAKRVGAKRVVVVAKQAPGVPFETQLRNMADNLRELVPAVEQAGVVLCLESVSTLRVQGLLLRHIADAHAVAKSVGSPAVRLAFDTFHVHTMDGDIVDNYRRVRDLTAVVQLSDCPERFEPGAGEIDFPRFLRMLRDDGFGGPVELENYLSQSGAEGERLALQRLRAIDDAV